MRCVLVNGARLKAPTLCAHCGNKISANYVREIGTRIVYCDFRCYSVAIETSVRMLGHPAPAASAWSRRS
jgi:hypothetical protein